MIIRTLLCTVLTADGIGRSQSRKNVSQPLQVKAPSSCNIKETLQVTVPSFNTKETLQVTVPSFNTKETQQFRTTSNITKETQQFCASS